MSDGDVQPNDRMMEVLQRAYNLPCYKPVIAVSSLQFVNSPSAFDSILLQQYLCRFGISLSLGNDG